MYEEKQRETARNSTNLLRTTPRNVRGSVKVGWLRRLRQRCTDLKVIVLSVYDEQAVRRAAMEAGADAYVLKRAIVTDLLAAVDLVCGGRSLDASTEESAQTDSTTRPRPSCQGPGKDA